MTPIVLVPGPFATPRSYAAQCTELWKHGPVQVANHTRLREAVCAMAADTGTEALVRQQQAIIGRPRSSPYLRLVAHQCRRRVDSRATRFRNPLSDPRARRRADYAACARGRNRGQDPRRVARDHSRVRPHER
jgi:hypothetical protein